MVVNHLWYELICHLDWSFSNLDFLTVLKLIILQVRFGIPVCKSEFVRSQQILPFIVTVNFVASCFKLRFEHFGALEVFNPLVVLIQQLDLWVSIEEKACKNLYNRKYSSLVEVVDEVVGLLLVRQIVAPRKHRWDPVFVLPEAPLPQILAKTCFCRQFSIRWVVIVKMTRLQLIKRALQIWNTKTDMKQWRGLILIHFNPAHAFYSASQKRFHLSRLAINCCTSLWCLLWHLTLLGHSLKCSTFLGHSHRIRWLIHINLLIDWQQFVSYNWFIIFIFFLSVANLFFN